MRRPKRTDDGGFTLIELVITIVILGVITLPLANFMVGYFKNFTQTQTRLGDSHDAQIAAAYFSQDVANTGLRLSSNVPTKSIWTTGFPPNYCGTGLGTPLLLLQWDDWTPASGTWTDTIDSVTYLATAGTLRRVFCKKPASGPLAIQSNTATAHNFVYPDASNSNPVTCPTACNNAPPPSSVNFKLGIKGTGDTSVWYVTLSGQRRQAAS